MGTLTVPTGTVVNTDDFSITITDTQTGKLFNLPIGLIETNATTYTYDYEMDWAYLWPGALSATTYYGNDAQSSAVKFTVAREPVGLQCEIAAQRYVTPAGASLTLQLGSPNGGTYTASFIGPLPQQATYSTFPNLTPDPNTGEVTGITAPTEYGYYQLTCSYSGSTDYAPAQGKPSDITISREESIAGLQLYTSPPTLQQGQLWQVYIVVKAPPGAPTPTGTVGIQLAQCFRQNIVLNPNGTVLARVPATSQCPVNQRICAAYQGDPYYKDAYYSFNQTNPPIPASILGSSSAGGAGSQGQATATPSSTATPTGTATGTPGSTTALNAAVGAPSSGGLPPGWS